MDVPSIKEWLWERAKDYLPFTTREEYLAELDLWSIDVITVGNGDFLGVVLRREDELHIEVIGGKVIPRRVVADALRPQIERYGRVITRTPINETRQQRLNLALGFVETSRTGPYVNFRLERDTCRLQL